jgi:hypothetical protein
MFKKRGQGQSWSLDIILAFVIFVLIIGIFYALLGNNKKDKTNDLTLESSTITNNLDSANANGQSNNPLTIINKGNIDNDKAIELYTATDYEDLKKQLGIKGEFCIYIVDQEGVYQNISGEQVFGNCTYNVTSDFVTFG